MPLPQLAKIAIQVAIVAATVAMNAMRRIEGPRLDDKSFTGGNPGEPWNRVYGTRRVSGLCIWAEELFEEKVESKSKGGKQTGYRYYMDAAYGVSTNPLDSIARILLDKKLVFDLTGAGPVTPFDFGDMSRAAKEARSSMGVGAGGINVGDFAAIYLGTADQEPDPYMQAFIEADPNKGEGWCPAYRHRSYVVFKRVPVEKFGNRFPQPEFLAVSSSAASYPYETFATETTPPYRLWGATFSSDYSRFMWSDGEEFEIWDVAARARMVVGTWPEPTTLCARYGLKNDGSAYAISADNKDLLLIAADGTSVVAVEDAFPLVPFSVRYQQEVRVIEDGNGTEHYLTIPWSTVRYFYVDSISDGLNAASTTDLKMENLTGVDWAPTEWFKHADEGSVWAVGRTPGVGATTAYFYRIIGGGDAPQFFSVSGLSSNGALGDCSAVYSDGHFILSWNLDEIHKIDPLTGAIVASATGLVMDVYNTAKQWANLPPGAPSIWLNAGGLSTAYEVSLVDLSVLRTLDLSDWNADSADGVIYDPISHALITANAGDGEIQWRYLDRVGDGATTLATIAEDIAQLVGVTDYDFSALDQEVKGWSISQGSAAGALEPLFDAFDSDIRPHDFALQGIKRSGVTAGSTLETPWFVRDGDAPRYTVKLRQAAELPLAVVYNFADVDADQQPSNVRSARSSEATGARGEKSLDMTTQAIDADSARALADRNFRRVWNERKELTLALTARELALEPGDVKTVDLDGESDRFRLVRITVRANDVLACEWKYDHPALAALGATPGASLGRDETRIAVPGISKAFVLDTPLVRDLDDDSRPLLYLGAAPYSDEVSWTGATIYEEDGETLDEALGVSGGEASTWGTAVDVLPDAHPWLWDRGSSVTVRLQYGALVGTTEAAIDANPEKNRALLGDEQLNFATAEDNGDGTWTLSGFKRGRRGTEWACAGHAAGERFVMLANVDDVPQGLSEVGTELPFRAVTTGRGLAGTLPVTVAPFTGASLKPYAPCHLEAFKQADGDWLFTWVRRTRVGGAWVSGTTTPLSEASEEYEITVGDGVDEDTITVTSPTYTWSLADQTTLTGGEVLVEDLVWSVAQVSDAVGAGFLAEAA